MVDLSRSSAVRRHRLGIRHLAHAAVMVCAGCAAGSQEGASEGESPPTLTNTTWQLVEFQSSSDEIGTIRPDDPSGYTMTLAADGTVTMSLDCNRATSTWSAGQGDSGSGSFTFGPLAMTRALCPPPSMDERIGRDAQYVRSFVLRNGRLYLSLMADGGIYAWEPSP